MTNRLQHAQSPYLLQHADNPVDWWPWTAEAFAEAKKRNVPVFLSVGYAACHWCHVMAHESFEDDATAKLINDNFLAIKVDREERPDVDAVYMRATQALTGQGGWPMSVFLTPDQKPFYSGTYFPPEPLHGLPSFGQVLESISSAWRQRHDEILGSADDIVTRLAQASPKMEVGTLTADDLPRAREELARIFDPINAGFGEAPKFPPSMVIEALLRMGDDDAMVMAEQTLEAMGRGGMYDQLAGGFARYSVDAAWVVPHFEKMLYDNALLLGAYTHWWRLSENPLAARIVGETVEWLLRELRTEQGAFASSLDADSLDDNGELREGAFYAWNQDQLVALLGDEDGRWAAEAFAVTVSGTFEHGLSTLQLLEDVDHERLGRVRSTLLEAREQRPRPGRDDKVVAAWNGWLIDALAQAAMVFDRPGWLTAAEAAAALIWDTHWVDGRLRRTSRDGQVGEAPGILEDYAGLAQSFVRLGSATGNPVWVDRALTLLDVVESQFVDEAGGFFDSAADAEALYARPQDPTDNATPSGLSSAIHALELMSVYTGASHYAAWAERSASMGAQLVRTAPRFTGLLLADAVSRLGDRPFVQVAIAGPSDDQRTKEMLQTAYRLAPAGSIIVAGPPDTAGVPLLADRPMINNSPTAYVCRHFVCQLPVTEVQDLTVQLGQPAR